MKIKVWTDGACSKNPGAGGWAYIAQWERAGELREYEASGYNPDTTNNQMELTAILECVKKVSVGNEIEFYTDSQLVIGWLSLGYRANVIPIANLVAQIKIIVDTKKLTISFIKVKGHGTDPMNIRVDNLAVKAYKEKQ